MTTKFILHTFFCFLLPALAMDNLKVAYEWKILDFDYPSDEARQTAIDNGEFIPKNNAPLGLEVYGDKLFVTVPRLKSGVPASLTYINMTSDPMDSPKLHPYPNWSSHQFSNGQPPQIVSPYRIRADKCDRLWIIDAGSRNISGATNPRLLIYNLKNDRILRYYGLLSTLLNEEDSHLVNLVVEDYSCEDSYAYIADVAHSVLTVYSFKTNKSWKVKHHYFNINPLAGSMNVSGVPFTRSDGLLGLALGKPDTEGYSTLYFHPMVSYDEFAVNTKFLRNESIANAESTFHEFKHLGSRGTRGQSGASFLHQKTDVLFYALINLNAVACWRTTNKAYTMESQGRIFMSDVSMVYPDDIKVDSDDNLWVLSNRLPGFLYDRLDFNEVNFRIMTAKVADAIRGTTCDSKLVVSPIIMDKISPVLNATLNKKINSNLADSETVISPVLNGTSSKKSTSNASRVTISFLVYSIVFAIFLK